MREMDDLISQLDIETDVTNLGKKDTDQASNDRNIKGKVKLDLNLEKNENQNEQTNKGTNKVSNKKKWQYFVELVTKNEDKADRSNSVITMKEKDYDEEVKKFKNGIDFAHANANLTKHFRQLLGQM